MDNENLSSCQDDNKEESGRHHELSLNDTFEFNEVMDGTGVEVLMDWRPLPATTANVEKPENSYSDAGLIAAEDARAIAMLERMTSSRLNQIRFGQTYNYENSVHMLLILQLLQEGLIREIQTPAAD